MNEELIKQIESMSLAELGDTCRFMLACIYNRLRDEEGFGCYQQCIVTDVGGDSWDNKIMFIDDTSRNSGLDWPRVWNG